MMYLPVPRLLAVLVMIGLGGLSAQPVDMDLLKNMEPRSIGPAGMSGRVTAIDVIRDQPDVIFAGTASGGLWKSESGGISWEPVFDEQKVASIGALAIYQKNPAIVWAGSGEGNPRNSHTSGYGVYKSLDGGDTWSCMGLEETRNIHRIVIHPENPEIVYVGAQGTAWGDSEHRGVYRTTDGGKTWEKILYVNQNTGIGDLIMDPSNPNKLMAAMWQFRRWPWSFKSGGPGSGLHVTYDGGENWKKLSDKDGLPKGELGRIGLAQAVNRPNIVYALVEAKKNALYGSRDGGKSWKKLNDKPSIGNRPFYYADIFVDPSNENRIYSIHSTVTWSEDGGLNFKTLIPYSGVHPDHHAWYIHPDDPTYLINGNDGGMAISRDMGKNWRFIENIPLAQYYHINVDNDYPYNVYGGMQDNGSWQGPAYVWRAGGIRNSYFAELYFGDGFDVVPDPEDNRYGYAMSQGGNVGRYDTETGLTRFVKPVHPEGKKLRFHWNAAIAQDPFDASSIYYGSQYVHKSTDKGDSWTIISPDLTTNDPEKQKQNESGGLTYDVTGAENHTTVIAIAPSPKDRNLIWAGTDDGNVQLSKDGGENWSKVSVNIPGMPEGAWVPQITASSYNAAEAFVVVNNYRQNDWAPYLYHTSDYGQTWTSMVSSDNIWGHTLSFVQDPIEPKLMFLGTEYHLYVSIDAGQNWTRWEHGMPTVAVRDMVIHPREHDLVMGTFGRAAFVLDDIRPIRKLAQKSGKMDQAIVMADAPQAVMASYRQADGTRFAADAIFAGDNRRPGAMLSYFISFPEAPKKAEADAPADKPVKKGKRKKKGAAEMEEKPAGKPVMEGKKGKKRKGKDSVTVEILDVNRVVIRTLKFKADTGMNRVYWRLDSKGVRGPRRPGGSGGGRGRRGGFFRGEPGGGPILPGVYTARVSFMEAKDSTQIDVIADPRIEFDMKNLQALADMQHERMAYIDLAARAAKRLGKAQQTMAQIRKLMPKKDSTEAESVVELRESLKSVQDSLKTLTNIMFEAPGKQGISRNPDVLSAKLWTAASYMRMHPNGVSSNAEIVFRQFKTEVMTVVDRVNAFFEMDWPDFETKTEAAELDLFPEFEPLELTDE